MFRFKPPAYEQYKNDILNKTNVKNQCDSEEIEEGLLYVHTIFSFGLQKENYNNTKMKFYKGNTQN